MIHLSDTLHLEPTLKSEQGFEIKKYAFPVELALILLFLFCTACGTSSGQPSAMQGQERKTAQSDSYASGTAADVNEEAATCGRQSYPVYQDVENQKVVNSDIESGSAQVILHFHNLGQSTIEAFLARTEGVLEVDSQWPDWGAISITVNENGLRQLSQDCAVRVIEANKRELPQ